MKRSAMCLGALSIIGTFLAGVWLLLAPRWLAYQPLAGPLTVSTKTSMVAGGMLVSVSSLTLLLVWAFDLAKMMSGANQQKLED